MSNNQLPQEKYLEIEEVWNEYLKQLSKDAIMANVDIKENSFQSRVFSDIIYQLSQIVQKIIQSPNGFEKIQAWLYRIDVPHQLIQEKLHQNTNYHEVVAELIFKRTLQKVVTRYLHKINKI